MRVHATIVAAMRQMPGKSTYCTVTFLTLPAEAEVGDAPRVSITTTDAVSADTPERGSFSSVTGGWRVRYTQSWPCSCHGAEPVAGEEVVELPRGWMRPLIEPTTGDRAANVSLRLPHLWADPDVEVAVPVHHR